MIPILGKENIVEYINDLRNKIRKEQNLQTGDEISKDEISSLYVLYGKELNDRVFARYVLDISYSKYQAIIANRIKTTKIFTNEKYTNEYINGLREEVISQNHLHINDEITYEEFEKIYNSCNHKLDIYTFALRILDINYNSVIQARRKTGKKCEILRRTKFSNTEILKLRKIIEENENIRDNSYVTYDRIIELYNNYGGILKEIDFVKKVLEIPKHIYYKAKRENKENKQYQIKISYKELIYSEEELKKIRLEIAKNYNLHIDDTISYNLFKKIYEKYRDRFTETRFAMDIFGIPVHSLENMKKNNAQSIIFETEELTENEMLKIRQNTIEQENLHSEDLIDYTELRALHKKYGKILSIQQFAENILDIPMSTLNNMKTVKASILSKELPDLATLIDITNRLINEYGIKIGTRITYYQFLNMYSTHGGNMSEKQFAEDILDLYDFFENRNEEQEITKKIMMQTTIDSEYINKLRVYIKKQENLNIKGKINKEKFENLYKKYGGILDKYYFGEHILDISNTSVYALLSGLMKSVTIFSNEKIDIQFYKEKRQQMIEKYHLHIGDLVDYEQFKILYSYFGFELTELDFAWYMLDITKNEYYHIESPKLREIHSKTDILSKEEISQEQIDELRIFFKQYEGKLIDYEQFKKLHYDYGGKMNEFQFCEQILGFKLNFIKYYKARASIKNPVAKRKSYRDKKKV